MSHEAPWIAPIPMAWFVTGPAEARAQVISDADRHHLGTAGRPEWREFAGAVPEGRALELRFDARANPGEATLLIRQRDVKLGWDVRVNGRALGQLLPMEASLVHALAVPAGTLCDGPNTLTIGPPPGADDVLIEQVALDPRPVRAALGRSTLAVVVTDADSGVGLPARITIVGPRRPVLARSRSGYLPGGAARRRLHAGRPRPEQMPPCHYMVSATRGFEYGPGTREVALAEGTSSIPWRTRADGVPAGRRRPAGLARWSGRTRASRPMAAGSTAPRRSAPGRRLPARDVGVRARIG